MNNMTREFKGTEKYNIVTILNVSGYTDGNGIAWLNLEHVARGLGFTEKKGNMEYVMWRRVNKYLNEFAFGTCAEKENMLEFIPENVFYKLCFKAKNETAVKFQNLVTDEILPTIRKHGVYATDEKLEQILLSPEFAIRVFTALKEEREAIRALELQIENDRPKVEFADSVETAKTTILIADLAKILNQNGVNIGQNRLFKWLRENNFLGVKGEYYNLPTQTSMDKKLFEIKETGWYDNGGNYRINKVTKVTGKGQIYFINRLKKELATA